MMLAPHARNESSETLSDGWEDVARLDAEAAEATGNNPSRLTAERVGTDKGSDFEADGPALSGEDSDDGEECPLMPPAELLQSHPSGPCLPPALRVQQRDIGTDPIPTAVPASPTVHAQSKDLGHPIADSQVGAAPPPSQAIPPHHPHQAPSGAGSSLRDVVCTGSGRLGWVACWLPRHVQHCTAAPMRPVVATALVALFLGVAVGAIGMGMSPSRSQDLRAAPFGDAVIDARTSCGCGGDITSVISKGSGAEEPVVNEEPVVKEEPIVDEETEVLRQQGAMLRRKLDRQWRRVEQLQARLLNMCWACVANGTVSTQVPDMTRDGPGSTCTAAAAVAVPPAGEASTSALWVSTDVITVGTPLPAALPCAAGGSNRTSAACQTGTPRSSGGGSSARDQGHGSAHVLPPGQQSSRWHRLSKGHRAVLVWQLRQAQQRVVELEAAAEERDAARAQLATVAAELAAVSAQRDAAMRQRGAGRADLAASADTCNAAEARAVEGRQGQQGLLAQLASSLGERDAAWAARDAAMDSHADAVNRLRAARQQAQAAHEKTQAALGERDAALAQVHAASHERQAALLHLESAITARDAALEQRDAAIGRHIEAVQQRSQALRARATALQQRDAVYAQYEAEVQRCEQLGSARAGADKHRDRAVRKLGRVRSQLDAALHKHKAAGKQVAAMREERDAAAAQLSIVLSERNAARHQLDRCRTELGECSGELGRCGYKAEEAMREYDTCAKARDTLAAEAKAEYWKRVAAEVALTEAIGERDAANSERDAALQERAAALELRDRATSEHQAAASEREYFRDAWLEVQAAQEECATALAESEVAQEVLVGGLLAGDGHKQRKHGVAAAAAAA